MDEQHIEKRIDELMINMEKVRERVNQPTQWYAVIGAVIPTVVLMAGFVTMVVQPVKETMEQRTDYLVSQLERYSDVVAKVGLDFNERMDEIHDRVREDEIRFARDYADMRENVGRLSAQNEMLNRRIEEVERHLNQQRLADAETDAGSPGG